MATSGSRRGIPKPSRMAAAESPRVAACRLEGEADLFQEPYERGVELAFWEVRVVAEDFFPGGHPELGRVVRAELGKSCPDGRIPLLITAVRHGVCGRPKDATDRGFLSRQSCAHLRR